MPAIVMQDIKFGIIGYANGVQMARNWLFPLHYASFVGFFNSAFGDTVFSGYVGTFFHLIYARGGIIAIGIYDVGT